MTPPLILLPVTLLITVAGGKQVWLGLRTGKANWLGQYRDWGPFDREEQPVRFWLSLLWSVMLTVGGLVSTNYILRENI